ncbi:MAG: TolC family protein [Endomicrobiaceae bacterium]
MSNKKIYIFSFFLFLTCPLFAEGGYKIEISTVSVINQNNILNVSLEQYQETVLRNNSELCKAKAEAEYARQESKAAFTKYFPKISASAAIANTDILPGFNEPVSILPVTSQSNGGSVVMLSATQPLFTGGRIINGNKLANSASKAADYKLQIKRNEIYSEAEKKYRRFQLLEGKMNTLISYEKMLDALYSQVSQAFEMGISSKSDFLRVKLKKEELSVQKQQLGKIIEIAAKDLKLYAEIDENTDIKIDKKFPSIEEPVYSRSDFQSYLKLRPEYKLLEIGVKVSKLQRNIEAGSYLPTIAVGASLFRTDYFSNNYFDKSAMHYQDSMAFAMVSMPLSDWWQGSHTIKGLNAKYNAAKEEFDSKSKYLLLDMENKLTYLETAYKQVRVAEIGFELAKTNRLEYEDGYKNGTEKLSDYLESMALEQEKQNKLDEAKADYFEAKTAFLISTAKLEY